MISNYDLDRIKYLIKKAMQFNLKEPEQVIIYLSQQGFDNIEIREIAEIMKEIMIDN